MAELPQDGVVLVNQLDILPDNCWIPVVVPLPELVAQYRYLLGILIIGRVGGQKVTAQIVGIPKNVKAFPVK